MDGWYAVIAEVCPTQIATDVVLALGISGLIEVGNHEHPSIGRSTPKMVVGRAINMVALDYAGQDIEVKSLHMV